MITDVFICGELFLQSEHPLCSITMVSLNVIFNDDVLINVIIIYLSYYFFQKTWKAQEFNVANIFHIIIRLSKIMQYTSARCTDCV